MSNRVIYFKEDTLSKLLEIMKRRGFPEEKMSESEIVDEAISLLYEREFKPRKSRKEG